MKEKNKYEIFQSYLKDAFDFHLDKVEILELRTDKEKLEFIEVLWINTFEAEEHLKTYDLGTKPVFHTLCGYASSYLSTVLQQPILVKEIECRAMGHEHCICMPISEGSRCQKQLKTNSELCSSCFRQREYKFKQSPTTKLSETNTLSYPALDSNVLQFVANAWARLSEPPKYSDLHGCKQSNADRHLPLPHV